MCRATQVEFSMSVREISSPRCCAAQALLGSLILVVNLSCKFDPVVAPKDAVAAHPIPACV